jgi:hypothetical protein
MIRIILPCNIWCEIKAEHDITYILEADYLFGCAYIRFGKFGNIELFFEDQNAAIECKLKYL